MDEDVDEDEEKDEDEDNQFENPSPGKGSGKTQHKPGYLGGGGSLRRIDDEMHAEMR